MSMEKDDTHDFTITLDPKSQDYNEYCLLWNVYSFMRSNAVNDSIIEAYIMSYSLNSETALYVAMKEDIDVLDSHLEQVKLEMQEQ